MSEGAQRRLAAIVAIDVAGYSRLMGADEQGTLAALKANREAVTPIVLSHGGRIVGSAGDGLLLEFPSVTEAVLCAVEIQPLMAERNADLPHERKMLYRIGVNLGDVMIDGDDIFGDGINVAARLEALAEPGGVALSDDVYRQVRDRIEIDWIDGGEHEVKNIARSVHVWRWQAGEASGGSKGDASQPAPGLEDNHVVAVLPFENMSGDPEQEYFADGITEDIITELSRWRDFQVLARNATSVYKGKSVTPMEVGRALSARFMLEGSVRKAGQRVRVTAQLIDTADGTHIWAERYDRDIEYIFTVQDEITQSIAGTLGAEIVGVQTERALRRPTNSVDAYDLYLKGGHHLFTLTKEGNEKAVELLEAAVAKDPGYARAYAMLAASYRGQVEMYWADDPDKTAAKALEIARQGVAADDRDPHAQQALGVTESHFGNHQRAIAAVRKSIEINPNRNFGHAQLALVLLRANRPEEALHSIEKAMALTPNYPSWFGGIFGSILNALGRLDDAEKVLADVIASQPNNLIARATLAVVQMRNGKLQAAKSTITDIRSINSNYTITAIRKAYPALYKNTTTPFMEALRDAGLPEE